MAERGIKMIDRKQIPKDITDEVILGMKNLTQDIDNLYDELERVSTHLNKSEARHTIPQLICSGPLDILSHILKSVL